MRVRIAGATLPDGTRTDLHIADGVFVEDLGTLDHRTIDADGLLALPGLVDLHAHLREPGFEHSETVLTASRAAASGGFTAVFAMANTMPAQDTAGVVEQVARYGDEAGYVEVRPVGAVSAGLAGEQLAELGAMARSRARVRVFSDDGHCVSDALLMRRALEYVKAFDGVIAQHAQEPRLTLGAQLNEGAVSADLGLAGWPRVAEESIIARDIMLAEHVGGRYHACHLSTRGSVELIRAAKAKGLPVTAEVTPHHLLLTEEFARDYDTRFKVNPPLRTADDVQALREAVADGTIDVVATDHAPHEAQQKCCEWDAAAMGMVGLESALSVVTTTLVDTGMIGWADVARILSTKPAEIGRVAGQGGPLAVGAPAELTLVDPAFERTWSTADLAGRSRNTPFTGERLKGRVVWTFHAGIPTLADGRVVEPDALTAARRAAAIGTAPTTRTEEVR